MVIEYSNSIDMTSTWSNASYQLGKRHGFMMKYLVSHRLYPVNKYTKHLKYFGPHYSSSTHINYLAVPGWQLEEGVI